MKKIITMAVIAISILSCGNEKNVTDNQTKTNTTTENVEKMVNGVVKDMSTKGGCGFIIVVKVNGNATQLEPLSLADEFKVDGKQVQLLYTPSRRPSKCMNSMPITIDKIK